MKTTGLKITTAIIIFFILLSNFFNTYAVENEISNENLKSSFQKFVSSQDNSNNYKIEVKDDNTILITTQNNEKYSLKYTLDEEVTFSLEMPIKNGMSYNDYKKQTENLILPMLGYVAIADIKGIEFNDSMAYFSVTHLNSKWKGNFNSDRSYTIIDENGNELVSGGAKTIEVNDFPNRVIEYINSIYKNNELIDDSNDINSFIWSVEKREENNSYKLISTLTINTEADFSKLKDYADTVIWDDNHETENNVNNANNTQNETNNNTDDTTKSGNLPAVGNRRFLGVVVGIAILILVVAIIRRSSYKE